MENTYEVEVDRNGRCSIYINDTFYGNANSWSEAIREIERFKKETC